MYKIVCLARFTVVTIFLHLSCVIIETFQDEMTSTQRSASSGFIQTYGEACIYKKVSGSSVAFLILYVDDILLIGNDI